MEKFFNIAGPCVAAKHYMLPAIAVKCGKQLVIFFDHLVRC